MLYPIRLNIYLEEQQVQDAVDVMKLKSKVTLDSTKFPCPEEIRLAIETGSIVALEPRKVTEYLVCLLRWTLLKWDDLPASLIHSIPLAQMILDDNEMPFDWTVLPDVCRFDVDVVLTGIHSWYLQWDDIPVHLQSNIDVGLAAWYFIFKWERETPNINADTSLPPSLNHDFFRMCIEQGKMDDLDMLPTEYGSSIDFARDIDVFPS
jgi:hypothetical protein